VSGITKGRSLNGKATKSVPYLRVANVQAGYLDLTEMKEIEATPTEIKGLTLLAGDIVLTEGGDYDKLGRGAQWRGEVTPCIHQNHVFRVRLHPDLAEPDYFEAYLQTHAATRYFLSVAKRTTNLASINMTQLRNLPVMLPSVEFQRAFVEQVSRVRSIQLQSSAASLTAQTTFNALLGRVFSQAPSETQEPVAQTRRQRAAIG
jgi:type I restriction enzyme S subunit